MSIVVCAGITVVDNSSFSLHYDPPGSLNVKCPVNVVACRGIDTARGTELKLAKGLGYPSLAVLSTRAEFPGRQHNLRREIISRLKSI